jgi:hypothetical protein
MVRSNFNAKAKKSQNSDLSLCLRDLQAVSGTYRFLPRGSVKNISRAVTTTQYFDVLLNEITKGALLQLFGYILQVQAAEYGVDAANAGDGLGVLNYVDDT